MADQHATILPPPSPEHRKVAAGQFERANEVLATGNHDYAIQLLLNCCKLDPANLVYRHTLRQTEKAKFKNNRRGSALAMFTTSGARARLKAAKRTRDYLRVLEHAEAILAHNPWDVGAQMDMADAAEALGLLDLAVWSLEQARQKNPRDNSVNRPLARLYEKAGQFNKAIALWEFIRKADPKDVEAASKAKDLAASDTIARTQMKRMGFEEHEAPAAAEETRVDAPEAETPASPPPKPPVVDRVANEAAPLIARIQADPSNANAYLHLAGLYRRVNQLEQARDVLRQGLEPTGNHSDIRQELSDLEIEPFRQNLASTDERIRANPDDGDLRKHRIRLLKEINTRELDLYKQKLEFNPADRGARFELGVRLLRAQRVDEAIVELQAARPDPRYQWRALFYLGFCFKQRNNWRLAQRNFEEALRHLPTGENDTRREILFQLATGAAENGDLARAIDLGNDLANIDFGYRHINQLIDTWQQQLDGLRRD
ncbi:MAG TPA: tetratricopeptide repeat protein [Gemmataceae bacterium]|nr:tetratricopeptide repeat protein [Gemmataceae bacterium]